MTAPRQHPQQDSGGDPLDDVAARALGTRAYSAADLRDVLDGTLDEPVDALRVGDDLLPQLAYEGVLGWSLRTALVALRPGGFLVAPVPDLGRLRGLRPTAPPPRVIDRFVGGIARRRVNVQLWDWDEDGSRYELEVVQLVREEGGWRVDGAVATRHEVLSPERVEHALADAGFAGSWRLSPSESGHPLPVWLAVSPR